MNQVDQSTTSAANNVAASSASSPSSIPQSARPPVGSLLLTATEPLTWPEVREVLASEIPGTALRIDYQAMCPNCKGRAMAYDTGHIACISCGKYHTGTADLLARLSQNK